MQKIRLISLLLLTFSLTAAQANSLDNGLLAYERGDYASANELLTPQAEAGNALAQFCLGYMNYMGVGVAQNQTQAVAWYQKAADQDFADAQYNLGYLYITGEGVERDVDAAVELLDEAAASGHALAAYELGVLYEFGDGLPRDWAKAKASYKLAAADGFQLAQQAYRRVTTTSPPADKPAPVLPAVAAIPPAPVAAASAQRSAVTTAATYRLKVDRVNLRNGPGSSFDIVDILPKGTLLRRLGTQGEWSHLKLQGGIGPEGWLVTRFLERLDGSSAEPVRSQPSSPRPMPVLLSNPVIRLFVKSSEANMRDAPSLGAPIVAKLSGGQPLELEGRDGDWALVEIPVDTGFKGWVHKDLLAWPN